MHYHHTAAGYRAEDARTQHLQRPTGRRPSITSSYPICTAVLQKRVCHPANETAKCSMCSSKCTVALARAPKTLRMKSADTPIDTNPFACPTRLCRTFCLFLRHTLMLVVQAGNAHSSVIPKRLLGLCRLFTNCSANHLPWAYCVCWHGCLQVCQQPSSTCASENLHPMGSRLEHASSCAL